jgi:hypothetical protein
MCNFLSRLFNRGPELQLGQSWSDKKEESSHFLNVAEIDNIDNGIVYFTDTQMLLGGIDRSSPSRHPKSRTLPVNEFKKQYPFYWSDK